MSVELNFENKNSLKEVIDSDKLQKKRLEEEGEKQSAPQQNELVQPEPPAIPQPKFKLSYANAMQPRHMTLVIEDNSFLNADLVVFLKRMKVDHKLVLDSWQGLDAVKSALSEGFLYDAIFVKLYMPILDGFDLSREIRALEKKFELNES